MLQLIKQAKAAPDIDNYLSFLVSDDAAHAVEMRTDSLHSARAAASTMLKNDIKLHYKQIPQASQVFVKTNIVSGLRDSNAQIRNFAGNVISELVRQAGVMGCPELLPQLLSMISNESGSTPDHAQQGAMNALLKVCEDNKRSLSKTYGSECPLDFLIPRLLDFMTHPSGKVRANAIASMNAFLPDKSSSVLRNLDTFLTKLFQLADDENESVRKFLCRAIVVTADVSPAKIAPHMEGLVDYMIKQQRNIDDEELALDAAEFWLFVSEDKNLRSCLGPHLSKVVPLLLDSMVYSEDEVLRLEGEAEDAEVEDREQDIKPQFASSKASRMANNASSEVNGVSNANGGPAAYAYEDDDLSEGEIEEYLNTEDGDDPESQWNLRKCSAAALDVLAGVFHEAVFEATLPYLKSNLQHSEWPNRESAVLAIGAIADGCMNVVEPHLPDLVPFLISLLQDKQPVVRQITCWSLGRYSAWASHLDEDGKSKFFLPMMDGILKRMLDNNKRVQEAAASAFANLEEKANRQLENPAYCEVIARQFAECFSKYKDRNMFILYDCIQTLAEHVGPSLQNSSVINSLMPALIQRWEKVSDQSQEMFPLLECLSYVASALGQAFAPYAVPIFRRSIRIIYQNLQDSLAASNNPELDEPPADFIVTSLDLLSSIIQALGPEKSFQLVTDAQPSLFDLLNFCLENPNNEVRQSAYALLGDCAIYVFAALQPFLNKIMPLLMKQLVLSDISPPSDDTSHAVINNACWSCGEIAMYARGAMTPFVETLLQRFYAILCSDQVGRSLHENAAIVIGRLGVGCADTLAPHAATFAPMFFQHISGIEMTDEKVQALKGISLIAIRNPQGLEHCLWEFVREIAAIDTSRVERMDSGPDGTSEAYRKVRQLCHFISLLGCTNLL